MQLIPNLPNLEKNQIYLIGKELVQQQKYRVTNGSSGMVFIAHLPEIYCQLSLEPGCDINVDKHTMF